jgi:HYDIN/CFA65/VesB family protein/centrosomal CEP192-like protein/immunoglobulin I-set domain protein
MNKTKSAGGIRNNIQTVVAAMATMLAFGTAAHAHVRARPSFVNFGSESVGSTSASHTVTITNDNSHSVTISSVSDPVAQFSYSGPSLPISLNPGQSLTGTVTFKPSAAQAYSGTLEFKRSTGSTIWVALRGTGIGHPTTSAPVAPTISSQPASAKITAGQTATFNIAATGTAPMTYQWKKNGAAISGATSSTYSTPAETTTDNNAKFNAEVSNSAGSAASIAAILTVSASTLLLNSSSPSLSFGSVNVSSNSTQSVTLTNAGNSSVTISNVTVSGAGFNAAGVSTGLILAPGQAASLTATFTPSGAGIAKGSISVASNATNSPDSISLSGTGVAAVNHSVALSWSPSTSTVVGYNTYSSAQSGGPYTKLTSVPVAATSYTDSAVQAGQTYYFVVTSVDSSNEESAYSAEVTALVP